ncbi:NfeD family protein [Pseudarthrobacter sp. J1738]|uniref:NfeD family protein n=1 Tax=Pseudarthrobacter sp. J1738 TaxID=3420446 RepID=UPI003D29FA23
MFEWLGNNWWALWLTVFLICAAVEMLTLDLFFIMLGGGAIAALISDFLGAPLWLEVIIFCLISLLMIALVRPIALRHLRKGPTEQLSNVDRLIGLEAVIIESVSEHGGLIKIGGDTWSARSAGPQLEPGQRALVSAIEGATAVVIPAAPGSAHNNH